MSLIGSYRYSSIASGSAASQTIVNFAGFQPSGLSNSSLLGVALYIWTGGTWQPLRREWLI